MTITTLITIFILAITVEALIEYGKLIFGKTINWTQIAAIVVSILLAVGAQVDLFAVVGVTFIIPYLGIVLTGLIFSRGANYTADFIKLLQNKVSNTNGAAGEGTESVPLRQKFMSIANYRIKSPHGVINPEFITIHNTANDASAAAEIAYMSRMDTGNNVSFHYAVDDKEIVQGLPENRSAIHAGTTAGNKASIAIEICNSRSGGAKFIQAEKNAAWLAAKILHERGWGIEHIRTHKSWSGKDCPHLTLLMGWPRFLNMVSAELEKYSSKPIGSYTEPTEPHQYRLKFTGNDAGWFEEQLHRIGYSWGAMGCKNDEPDEIAASKVWDILDYEMDQSGKPRGAAGKDIREYLKSLPSR